MTRNFNMLNHFNTGFGLDAIDYRHPSRLPMHGRGSFGMSARANLRTDPMARSQGQQQQAIRSGFTSHPATVQSNANETAPLRKRVPVAVRPRFS